MRVAIAVCLLLSTRTAVAVPYHVSIDTSALGISSFRIAFDLIDGGAPSNSVAVTAFTADGTLGVATSAGGVTGGLPGGVSLTDTRFFNEYLQIVSSAHALDFDFEASANGPESAPDTFSFFLLDALTELPLFRTTDTTGTDSLFILEIDGRQSGHLAVFSTDDPRLRRTPDGGGSIAAKAAFRRLRTRLIAQAQGLESHPTPDPSLELMKGRRNSDASAQVLPV